jgi:hypothetical protein
MVKYIIYKIFYSNLKNKGEKIMKKKLLIIIPILILMLTGCTPKYYTDEYLEEKTLEYNENASVWFEENFPDAKDITYNAYVTGFAVSNLCNGTFELNGEEYKYALNMDDYTLYTDKTKDGITYQDLKPIALEILQDYYKNERNIDVDISMTKFNYNFFCNTYTQTSGNGKKIYNDEDISINKNQKSNLSYLEWNTKEENLYDLCLEWLQTNRYLSRFNINLKIVYNDFEDIKPDLKEYTIIKTFPSLYEVFFTDINDNNDDIGYNLKSNGDVTYYYYEEDKDGNLDLVYKNYK